MAISRSILEAQGHAFLQLADAVRERDRIRLNSIELESRTPVRAAPGTGLREVETFVFVVTYTSLVERQVRFEISVTPELALAQMEEEPQDANTLISAWTELTVLADLINECGCRGGFEAARSDETPLQLDDAGARDWLQPDNV